MKEKEKDPAMWPYNLKTKNETTGNKSASVTDCKPTEEYLYAKSLAEYLWEKHYKEDAPEWEPLADLMGVLSQIDNMIAGI